MKCLQKRTIVDVIEGDELKIYGVNINGQKYLLHINNIGSLQFEFKSDTNKKGSDLPEMTVYEEKDLDPIITGTDLRFEELEINNQHYSLNVTNQDGMLDLAFNLDKNKRFGSVPEYMIGIDYKGICFSRYVSRPKHDHSDIQELQIVVNPNTLQTKGQSKGDLVWRSKHYSKEDHNIFYVPFEKTDIDEQNGVSSILRFSINIDNKRIGFSRYVNRPKHSNPALEYLQATANSKIPQTKVQKQDDFVWRSSAHCSEEGFEFFHVPFGKITEDY